VKILLRLLPAIALPLLVVLLGVGVVIAGSREVATTTVCGEGAVTASPVAGAPGAPAPAASVAGYSGAQLVGAAAIMKAGADSGVPVFGQTIGVMTSMGESALTAVDHGDLAGPDSLGWFQQRDPWGPREVRLDAYGSAVMFFTGGRGGQRGLLDVQGWQTMTPTAAAHAVQRNADPWHYEKYWPAATAVVAALGGGLVPSPATGGAACQETPPLAGGAPTAEGWTKPAVGRFTSGFGMRWGRMHNGADIGAPLGTPVVAAADGIVVMACLTNARPCGGYGTLVAIDHGGGVVTRYAHATPANVLVRVGDRVQVGQQITRVGTYGDSTGPHLHFEILQGGSVTSGFIDPVPFLRARGVDLTGLG